MGLESFIMPLSCPCCGCEWIGEKHGSCSICYEDLKKARFSAKNRCKICFSLTRQVSGCRRQFLISNQGSYPKETYCGGRQIFFDRHISLCQLSPKWARLLQSWKYQGNRCLHQAFLPLLLEGKIQKLLSLWKLQRVGYIDSGSRSKDLRPFQPCHDIAIYLAKLWEIPWGKDIRKCKAYQQSKKKYGERFFSIHNALEVTSVFPSAIIPSHYLLIEDVYTTGATANEAARILKQNGVKRVFVLSMLKAGKF